MTPARALALVAVLALAAAAGPAGAAAGPAYVAPRTPWGAPDLSGVWTNQTATHLERPKEYAGLFATDAELEARAVRLAAAKAAKAQPVVNGAANGDVGQGASEFVDRTEDLMTIDGRARTSVITDPADGRLPLTEEGRRLIAAAKTQDDTAFDDPEDRSPSERCLASPSQAGPPMMSGPDDANYEIVQTPGRVAVLSEMIHDVRLVPIGGVHAPVRLHPYQGDGVGRWEGDALVIETVDQNPLTAVREVDGSTFLVTPQTRVEERLRRISPNEILYDFTVTDPAIYTRPWSGEMVLRKVDKPIYEYACHEGNYALANILSGAREKEKRGAAPGAEP